MKIDANRLNLLLAPLGFEIPEKHSHSLTFCRPDNDRGVYQKICVDFQGRRKEAVSAHVFISVTKFMSLKIEEFRELKEIAGNKERAWTIIATTSEARVWEHKLAETAPSAVERFSAEHANALRERTSRARHRTAELMQHLDSTRSVYAQLRRFESQLDESIYKRAVRLSEWPGVMQVYDADEIYQLACCAVLSGREGVAFLDQDPLHNDELMWQIQLVADGLLVWGLT